MTPVEDRRLERQGRRLAGAGVRWLVVGGLSLVPGIALFVIGLAAGIRWMWPVGLALIVLGSLPLFVGFSLMSSGAVSRWAARHKTFA